MADNVNINQGTQTPIASDDVAGVQFQKVKINLGGDGVDGNTWSGNIGTITTLPNVNMASGTVNSVTTVSNISNGTIRVTAGTIREDPRTTTNILTYGTQVTGTTAISLVGAPGSGTSIWVNDLSIVNSGGTTNTVIVGFGTAQLGTNVLVRGSFAANSGIVKSFPKAVNAGMTNTALQATLSATGTVDINITYFVSA